MEFNSTKIEKLIIASSKKLRDDRGFFSKIYSNDFFSDRKIDIEIKESYFSISKIGVIRGMHFQTPPFSHTKIVYVPSGRIVDITLDIRKGSKTFGEFFEIELSSATEEYLIIPPGLAHGFKCIEDDSNVTYLQTTVYSPGNDTGINFSSFGFDWNINSPVVSKRDRGFRNLSQFDSPFILGENC